MSGQGLTKELVKDLIAQVEKLTASDSETPRTSDQICRISLHCLLRNPVRAAIYYRAWVDRTEDIQQKLITSSPPSGTTVRTYHEPWSYIVNETVSETTRDAQVAGTSRGPLTVILIYLTMTHGFLVPQLLFTYYYIISCIL